MAVSLVVDWLLEPPPERALCGQVLPGAGELSGSFSLRRRRLGVDKFLGAAEQCGVPRSRLSAEPALVAPAFAGGVRRWRRDQQVLWPVRPGVTVGSRSLLGALERLWPRSPAPRSASHSPATPTG